MGDQVLSFLAGGVPTAVTAANPLPVAFGGAGGTLVNGQATAANPAYVNNTPNPLSMDLSGQLRTVSSQGGNYVVVGNVASGAADSGQPVKVGGVFNAVLPTFANGQRGDLQIDSRGELLVAISNLGTVANIRGAGADGMSNTEGGLVTYNRGNVFNGTTWDRQLGSIGDGTVNKPYALRTNDQQFSSGFGAVGVTTIFPAAGAGVKNFLTAIQIGNATTADVSTNILMIVKDGATEIWRTLVNQGLNASFTFPTPLQGSANTAMTITLSSTVGGAVSINIAAQGYKG